ncbi:MAG: tRNA (guanosine(37)-N1)-methyltransferase TrmD [Thermoanaerobaculia bacterium]
MDPRDSTSPVSPADLIAVGVVRRAHGVRGEISVELLTDTPERFDELDGAWLVSPDREQLRRVEIESVRHHKDRVLIKLEGVDAPEAVRPLQLWTLEVEPDQARELEEGEFFLHDLIGLAVVAPDGRRIGEVTDAGEGGGGILLAVRRPDGGTFDLPFASSICTRIDPAAGEIVVDLPGGLENLGSADQVEPDPKPRQKPDPESNPDPRASRLRLDFVSIFPAMFEPLLAEGVVARAIGGGILTVRVWDLRDFASDRHRSTDDEAYGGGAGMVMLAEPVFRCLDAIRATGEPGAVPTVILPSPQGAVFNHEIARELASGQWLIFLCGRYEGFDERVRLALVDREVSIGDFVVSGGELPAMLIGDAVARLVEGVVGDWNSVEADSFYTGLLDHPHYTRPAELRGLKVPEVLLSGHAEKIRQWRKEQSLRATLEKRPDLLKRVELDREAERMLEALGRPEPK